MLWQRHAHLDLVNAHKSSWKDNFAKSSLVLHPGIPHEQLPECLGVAVPCRIFAVEQHRNRHRLVANENDDIHHHFIAFAIAGQFVLPRLPEIFLENIQCNSQEILGALLFTAIIACPSRRPHSRIRGPEKNHQIGQIHLYVYKALTSASIRHFAVKMSTACNVGCCC
jgi:hypothetical protein